MNRIKDFFYNRNDVIVVLLILALAALIIYHRIEIIMDYPQTQGAQAQVQTVEEQVDTTETDE